MGQVSRVVGSVMLALFFAACTADGLSSTLDISSDRGSVGVRPTAAGDTDPSTHPGDAGNGPTTEVCDGWDNDRDGEVDEGLSGLPCTTENGVGKLECLDGRLSCRECIPGETRQEACGCSLPRLDICNDSGRWLHGACATCEQTPQGTDCGFCGVRGAAGECIDAGECNPGEIMYVRCDLCGPEDPSCGSGCVGQKWVCQSSCNWVMVQDCAPRSAQCDRDEVHYEPCGMCGYQKVECDGCFWTASECHDEGICAPGTTKTVPCFEAACAEGLYSVTRCTDSCTWEEGSCHGCIPGPPTPPVTEACVAGYDCGVKITQQQCRGSTQAICGGADALVVGRVDTIVLRDDCAGLACLPGEVTHDLRCTMGDGSCGIRDGVCGSTCGWGATGTCHHACEPSESSRVVACPEGCYSYTVTTICDGCGYHDETTYNRDCTAQCTAGETRQVDCGNSCTVRWDSCDPNTCTWRQGTCELIPGCG